MPAKRIAVIGFGFSGLMVTAQLVTRLPAQSTIYIIADDLSAHGMAYATTDTQHLLNVPVARMSAWPDQPDHLLHWLNSPDAALAKQQLKLTENYGVGDFIPRALYAKYLDGIWLTTQQEASERHCFLKLVETTATRIDHDKELAVLTARGDAIAVDDMVLACGNETKTIYPQLKSSHIIQSPWKKESLEGAQHWQSPVLLLGSGLTAIDTILSLRAKGYAGEIIAMSRNGRWPAPHASSSHEFQFNAEELLAQPSLSALLHYVRQHIKKLGEWRPVIDALRPHTKVLWQKLSARDQARFLARVLSLWNVRRHRMAPQIAATLESEMAQGTLRLLAAENINVTEQQEALHVNMQTKKETQAFSPSRLINCTGSELRIARSTNTLLKQALAEQIIEPHANGIGMAVDKNLRAWGAAHPHLHVIGSWMTGQWLESTAVPELRVQAEEIAQKLVPR